MNKSNGITEQTTLNQKEQKFHHNHQHSHALPTFFKWFKKDFKHSNSHEIINSTQSAINFGQQITPSSSCDSIISTSTTGFTYIKPSNYKPEIKINERKLFLETELEIQDEINNKYRMNNCHENKNLSLRTKYRLYSYNVDTLKSNNNESFLEYDNRHNSNNNNENTAIATNSECFDRSLPNVKNKLTNESEGYYNNNNNNIRRHRRTVSESSKEKRSGAYVHVKGKRKAPQPPHFNLIENQNHNRIHETINSTCQNLNKQKSIEKISPGSTLSKKKRKAPPPPLILSPTIKSTLDENYKLKTSTKFFSDKDIRAILNREIYNYENLTQNHHTDNNSVSLDLDYGAVDKLTNMQKQTVLEKVVEAQTVQTSKNNEINKIDYESKQSSPISPKPWYKRPISYNRESSIPFKREIVLKTMEKRKQKQKEKESAKNSFPEVSYSRSSIFDTSHKFGFFMRHKDSTNEGKSKDKEKRRSGIGIPNISELDREAAAIVNEEQLKLKDEQNSRTSDHVILKQQMFLTKHDNSAEIPSTSNNEEKSISTKDLISKFDLDSETPKMSLNTSFIGRSDLFTNDKAPTIESSIQTISSSSTSSPQTVKNDNEKKSDNQLITESHNRPNVNIDLKDEDNTMPKLSWSCPVCTLENPSWRIMCEVCERLKPFEKFSKFESKPAVIDNKSIEKLDKPIDNPKINLVDNLDEKPKNDTDWNKKTEKVIKYFKTPQDDNVLSKSPSESNIGKNKFGKKSSSPSKLPIGSPKLSIRNKLSMLEDATKNKSQITKSTSKSIEKSISPDKAPLASEDEMKQPLLDSSVVVTTVTPVFYATKALNENSELRNSNSKSRNEIDLKEVRNARILKFTQNQNTIDVDKNEDDLLNDPNYLEMEKKRLRDKIRAMNAKALTEKYPILQKTTSLDDNNDPEQIETKMNQDNPTTSNQGAVKKILPPEHYIQQELKPYDKIKSEKEVDDFLNEILKPKKVSAFAQTSIIMKKDSSVENEEIQFENIYKELSQNKPILNENKKTNENKIQEPLRDNNVQKITNNVVNDIKTAGSKEQEIQIKSPSNDRIALKSATRFLKKEVNRTDTIALNKIMKNLELAIAEGNDELAARIAMDLAKMKVSLQVTKNRNEVKNQNDQKSLTVSLLIEDKTLQKRLEQLKIEPKTTILELKQKVFKQFNIPIEEQKWLINGEIANDNSKTLKQYNVIDNSSKFQLYVVSASTNAISKNEKLSKLVPTKAIFDDIFDDFSDNETSDVAAGTNETHGATALPSKLLDISNTTWICPLCTLINSHDCETCSACSKAKPQQFLKDSNNSFEFVPRRQPENKNDLNKSNSSNRKSAEILNIIDETITKALRTQAEIKNAFHISSPNITKYKYRGVDNFNPNRKGLEQTISVTTSKEIEQKITLDSSSKSLSSANQQSNNHYLQLLDLENSDIVLSIDTFECPICFMKFQPGEGIILRDCLHTFCKECLVNTVQFSEDAEIKCPYMDAEYSCTSVIQEREIKGIVPKDIYELHLAKSVRVAEHQIENTFHCKTPNCRGWCIYEDNVNQFKCPVCKITNCLTCRVIHDGLSCKQYQDRLNSDCDSNIEARRTKEMLKEMVEKGEAMNCPTCQVVLMKKWGCDWLKCSMCKTEICWVTRGSRWGPGGKGDTSAGCKCGVDGKKCHPKCNYCH